MHDSCLWLNTFQASIILHTVLGLFESFIFFDAIMKNVRLFVLLAIEAVALVFVCMFWEMATDALFVSALIPMLLLPLSVILQRFTKAGDRLLLLFDGVSLLSVLLLLYLLSRPLCG